MWMLQFQKNNLVHDYKCQERNFTSCAAPTIHRILITKENYESRIESIELLSQSFYMVIVLARLVIPKRHCSLEQMSNLGLLLLGTASDLQEFQSQMGDMFEANEDKDWIKCVFVLVLITWTWSVSLMAINLDRCEWSPSSRTTPRFLDSLVQDFFWKITINLFLNDIPYLLVRLLIIQFDKDTAHENIFFVAKNVIGIAVGVSRVWCLPPAKKQD
jgi:hypothetical protein